MKRLCDGKCNECGVLNSSNSKELTKILNMAYNKFGEEFYKIVQSNCPNLTGCAECHINHFTHTFSCTIADVLEEEGDQNA